MNKNTLFYNNAPMIAHRGIVYIKGVISPPYSTITLNTFINSFSDTIFRKYNPEGN